MKRNGMKLALAVIAAMMLAVPSMAYATDSLSGAAAAASDSEYTLEEMLTYAMEDELAAKAEYNAILDAYGMVRPFSNIVKAEETHINLLLPLFEEYGITVPVSDADTQIIVPDSIEEAKSIGVTAEQNNISMYQAFLAQEFPDDVRVVFEQLSAASEKHLAAFEKNGAGNGMGNQNGSRQNNGSMQNNGARQGAGNGMCGL